MGIASDAFKQSGCYLCAIQRNNPYFRAAANFRTEEPLKGYRQWVLDDLVARARKNEVI